MPRKSKSNPGVVSINLKLEQCSLDYRTATTHFQRVWLQAALQHFGGNLTKSSRQLGVSRRTLQIQVNKHDIDLQAMRQKEK